MNFSFPYIFALQGRSARYHQAEVLVFWEEKIELLYRGEVKQAWPYDQVNRLIFYAGKRSKGLSNFLWLGWGRKGEDQWELKTEDTTLSFTLEIDSRFRRDEIQQLCSYLKKLPLQFEEKMRF